MTNQKISTSVTNSLAIVSLLHDYSRQPRTMGSTPRQQLGYLLVYIGIERYYFILNRIDVFVEATCMIPEDEVGWPTVH